MKEHVTVLSTASAVVTENGLPFALHPKRLIWSIVMSIESLVGSTRCSLPDLRCDVRSHILHKNYRARVTTDPELFDTRAPSADQMTSNIYWHIIL